MAIGFSEDGLMACADWQALEDANNAELDAKGITGMARYTYQTDVVKGMNKALAEMTAEPFDFDGYISTMASAAARNADMAVLDILQNQG